jgi:AraC-like DNA-binding protein
MCTKEDIYYFCAPLRTSYKINLLHPIRQKQHRPLNVVLAGRSYCGKKYRISRQKDTPLCCLLYVVKGKGVLESPQGVFFPTQGDVMIIHANAPTCYYTDADDLWELMWFNFTGELIHSLLNCYGLDNIWYLPDCHVQSEFQIGLDMLKSLADEEISEIAVFALRLVQSLAAHAFKEDKSIISSESWALKNFIDANYTGKISLDEMAASVRKSKSQTVRLFKRDWGITPYQYLLDCKLQAAKIYLTGSNKSIKEIAFELGFNDEFHLSSLFKKRTGISPINYRHK